jgi:GNAT superfamily N-acetyltransferase
MNVQIRPALPSDVNACGRIIFESFKEVSKRHNFPCDFPSVKIATHLVGLFINDSLVFSIVAEVDGSVVGCNFLHEGHLIRSIGPLCVSPDFQLHGIGRQLMEKVMDRAKGSLGIRLIQETLNIASLSLYTSLGFDTKDALYLIKGRPKTTLSNNKTTVRPLALEDIKLCGKVCLEVCKFERTQDVENAVKSSSPFSAFHGNRLIAYSTSMTMWMTNHCVAKTEEDMKTLIAGIGNLTSEPLSFLLPIRYANLFRWCTTEGFRVYKPFTLMAMGEYNEHNGIYFPSASF